MTFDLMSSKTNQPKDFRQIIREAEVPKEITAEMEAKRQELIECVSNSDDVLGDMFLEEKVPDNQEVKVGLNSIQYPICSYFIVLRMRFVDHV